MLRQTRELLAATGQKRLHDLLLEMGKLAIEQPDDFKGGAELKMYTLQLSLEDCQAIQSCVQQAVAQGVTTSGTRSRGLGGFVEAWSEYTRHLQRSGEHSCV